MIYLSPMMLPLLTLFITLILHIQLLLPMQNNQVLSERTISLEERQGDPFINSVFKDNILLNLAYMRGEVHSKKDINWDKIREPFVYRLELKHGEVFAFHDDVIPAYQSSLKQTTNAHFNGQDGFKSDGYLMGDGVCHLASLIYWAAKDAQLESHAPTNHDFAVINEIPREYGVSIYFMPGSKATNAQQNLYVRNSFQEPVSFVFTYDDDNLTVSLSKTISHEPSPVNSLLSLKK